MSSSAAIQRNQHGSNKSAKVVSMCKEIRHLQIRNEQYTTHYQNLLDHLKFELSRGRHLDQLAARPKPPAPEIKKQQRGGRFIINRIHKYCSQECKDKDPASSLGTCSRCNKSSDEVYCNSAWTICANCSCKHHICVFCGKKACGLWQRAPKEPVAPPHAKATLATIVSPKSQQPTSVPASAPISKSAVRQSDDDHDKRSMGPQEPKETSNKPKNVQRRALDKIPINKKDVPKAKPKPKPKPKPRPRKPKRPPPAPKEKIQDILNRSGRWFRPWAQKQREAACSGTSDGENKGQPAKQEPGPSSAVVNTGAESKEKTSNEVDSHLKDRIKALEALQASVRKAMVSQFVAEYKTYPHTGLYSSSVLWRQDHLVNHGMEEYQQEEERRREADNQRDRDMHHDYLKAVISHAKAYREYHRNKHNAIVKLAKQLKAQMDSKERDVAREQAKKEQARLEALKNNDMEAYQQLIKQYKDERVEFLMSQTSEYLKNLSHLVETQKTEIAKDKVALVVGEEEKEGQKATHSGAKYHLKAHATREKVRCQPSMLTGGTLKDYQMVGLEWLVSLYNNSLNGILADEMGLGKTIQTIALLSYLMEIKKNNGPFLIVVPLSTLTNWDNELIKWAPKIRRVVYKGSRDTRKEIRVRELAAKQFNCLLTTYDYVIKDKAWLKKLYWEYIIVDEGHRMKNSRCKFSLILGHEYRSRHRLLLTGTPLQNNLTEMWSLLNFLLPKVFDSINNFEQWFSAPFRHFRNSGGSSTPAAGELSEEERLIIINRLHAVLRPFLLRRVKADVLDQLPEKVEKVIKCDLSAWQRIEYDKISQYGVASVRPGRKRSTRVANELMQLRKICNHPYLFLDEDEWEFDENLVRSSGKVELLDRILPKLRARGHRVLIFSQMTKLLTILQNFLRYKNYQYVRLDGQVSQEKREQAMYQFNAPDSPHFVFLLSTRAGGLGVNLATADTVIIFDSDWNPQMDLQAQARAHRIGQMREVRVFRLISRTSMEEKMLACTNDKLEMEKLVIKLGLFKKGRHKSSSAENDNRKAIRDILAGADRSKDGEVESHAHTEAEINEMLARDEDEFAEFQLMDARAAADREKDWADRRQNNPNLPEKPSRLMTVEEVPDYIRAPAVDPHAKNSELVLGPRKRKAVDYTTDRISDREYFDRKFGQLEDREPPKKRKADSESAPRSSRKRKMKSEPAMDQPTPKRAPGSARKKTGGKDSKSGRTDKTPKGKRAKSAKGKSSKTSKAKKGKPIDSKWMAEVLEVVKRSGDEDGNLHCIQFLELPSRELYPDYFDFIKTPISLYEIESKIKNKEYMRTDDFTHDFKLMIENAKAFNCDGSAVYVSAQTMEKIFDAELEQLMQ